MLELPKSLWYRRIHPTFHLSLIHPHQVSVHSLFPNRLLDWVFRLEDSINGKWHVDEILDHRFSSKKGYEFRVLWTMADRTWEPLANCEDLQTLDEYLELRGSEIVNNLPKSS
jgi:hypothetical protein